jgi:hypothetical protein
MQSLATVPDIFNHTILTTLTILTCGQIRSQYLTALIFSRDGKHSKHSVVKSFGIQVMIYSSRISDLGNKLSRTYSLFRFCNRYNPSYRIPL